MADVICSDVCLWIRNVGCGLTRRVMLGLEPGAQIWLEVEGEPVLFERMKDGSDGRSTRGLRPVGETAVHWRRHFGDKPTSLEIDFIERPLDAGRSAERW